MHLCAEQSQLAPVAFARCQIDFFDEGRWGSRLLLVYGSECQIRVQIHLVSRSDCFSRFVSGNQKLARKLPPSNGRLVLQVQATGTAW
jgi:hypothetical protein